MKPIKAHFPCNLMDVAQNIINDITETPVESKHDQAYYQGEISTLCRLGFISITEGIELFKVIGVIK